MEKEILENKSESAGMAPEESTQPAPAGGGVVKEEPANPAPEKPEPELPTIDMNEVKIEVLTSTKHLKCGEMYSVSKDIASVLVSKGIVKLV